MTEQVYTARNFSQKLWEWKKNKEAVQPNFV